MRTIERNQTDPGSDVLRGFGFIPRNEYHAPDGEGGFEQDGDTWVAWRGARERVFPNLRQAARYARGL